MRVDVAGDRLQKLKPTFTTFFKLVSICVLVDRLWAGFVSYNYVQGSEKTNFIESY